MSGREIVSIHIGQGGIQMGASLWEQYCKEHKLTLTGVRKSKRYRMMERMRKNSTGEWEKVETYNPFLDSNRDSKTIFDENKNTSSEPLALDTEDSTDQKFDASEMQKKFASANRNQFRRSITKVVPFEEPIGNELEMKPTQISAAVQESHVFFSHSESNDTHCPRAVMVDLEPNVIDDVMNSPFGSLFNHSHLLKGMEDAANNYARGRYTVGADIADQAYEALRKQVEQCENCQGFIFNQAVAGGTGSGFGGLTAEHLSEEYRKIPKISFAIYPSQNLSNAVVEPYNALLATHDLINHNQITILLDNEAGYEICQTKLGIPKPSFFNINRLIGKVASSVTSGIRFSGQQQFAVADLQTNLVPYPRLHFMTCGMGPILSENSSHDDINEFMITDAAFRMDHMFTKYHNWDSDIDKYMGISVTFRGNCLPGRANAAVQELKGTKVKLVDWCPTGFKISMIDRMPSYLGDDGLKPTDKACVMIGNNVAVIRPFEERIARKYDVMYSQRAFVHWYVGEGMEEGEFAEAREDLEMLINDYRDSLNDQVTDAVDSDADVDDNDGD